MNSGVFFNEQQQNQKLMNLRLQLNQKGKLIQNNNHPLVFFQNSQIQSRPIMTHTYGFNESHEDLWNQP